MEYQVLFDVGARGYRLGVVPALALISMFAAAGFSYFAHVRKAGLWKRAAAYGSLSLTALLAAVIVASTYVEYQALATVLKSDVVKVVEGEVRRLTETPSPWNPGESFTVGGIRFHYSAFHYTHSFRKPRSRGGPIREGLPVRIHYGRFPPYNMILRLEAKTQ